MTPPEDKGPAKGRRAVAAQSPGARFMTAKERRESREAAALRENLKRRKAPAKDNNG